MSTPHSSPDPVGLAISGEIHQRVHPPEIILSGSRYAGDHRPGSDLDLASITPGEAAARRTKEAVSEILKGRRSVPELSVLTTTREEFDRTALQGQSLNS